MISRYRDAMSLVLLGVLLALPIALWQVHAGVAAWSGAGNILQSIGQICALLGASLFTLNFVLAARLRWLEDMMGGLPRMYNAHHTIGGMALILLLMHPLFLGLQYLPVSLQLTASFFIPDLNDVPKLLGVLALAILVLLLVITFFVRIAYHKWKATHQWMGLALLFASLHVYLIPGNLSSTPGLRFYMVSIIVLGLIAFAYRVLLGRWLVYRHPYEVASVTARGDEGTEITLRVLQKPITYYAGQFFFLQTRGEGGVTREPHPFSFTSPPDSSTISFAAKPLGDYTSTLPLLQPGSKVDIEGPYGRFIFSHGTCQQVWIAGGIGITPFISRARELEHESGQQVTLHYTIREKADAMFVAELRAIEKAVPYFTLHLWESASEGHLTADAIYQENNAAACSYFICGPDTLMKDMKRGLKEKGVKNSAIYMEEFKLY